MRSLDHGENVDGTGQDPQLTTQPAPAGEGDYGNAQGDFRAKTQLVLSDGKEATTTARQNTLAQPPVAARSSHPKIPNKKSPPIASNYNSNFVGPGKPLGKCPTPWTRSEARTGCKPHSGYLPAGASGRLGPYVGSAGGPRETGPRGPRQPLQSSPIAFGGPGAHWFTEAMGVPVPTGWERASISPVVTLKAGSA